MRTVTKKEAFDLYDKLTDLAYGMAAAQNTTPDKSQDSICQRWKKFNGIDEMEDDMLLLLTDEDSPLFFLYNYHHDKTNLIGGIMSVPIEGFKDIHKEGKKLYANYTDGSWECFHELEKHKDVYYLYSVSRGRIIDIMANQN